MSFFLHILGTSSALPTMKRYLSAQVLNAQGRFFLIDCGEATQMQMLRHKINVNKIDNIFISHLHGDHFFGLFGLLSTLDLMGRKKKINIFAHRELENILSNPHSPLNINEMSYKIQFHHLGENVMTIIYDDSAIEVRSFPLSHRIACSGFLFTAKENPKKNIIKEKISEYNLSVSEIIKIKNGEDYISPTGEVIDNKLLTYPKLSARHYAYCTDTVYIEQNIQLLQNVDLLYHEATYEHKLKDLAEITRHTTAYEAGLFAKKANVKKLLLGHFSSRYHSLTNILEEARQNFEKTLLAKEGEIYEI